jgi:DNA-binding NarL/FixJ family response regulator
VEDEFLIALDLEAAMTGHGFEICGLAPNAEEARSLAMNHLPDVVLVDVYLGGAREGIETARWLRDVCDASVVLVTAHTDDATLERIREVVPGSPILAKPVYRESLPAAVAEVVHASEVSSRDRSANAGPTTPMTRCRPRTAPCEKGVFIG